MVDGDHCRPHHVAHDLVPGAETGVVLTRPVCLGRRCLGSPGDEMDGSFAVLGLGLGHGSFAIGLAYVGLTIIVERDWKALPTAIVAGLSTFLTAHGLGFSNSCSTSRKQGRRLRCSPNGGGQS